MAEAKRVGQVQDSTLLRVKQTFEGIKEAFLREKGETFLTTHKLIGSSTNWVGWTILRSLVADNMLERQVTKPADGRGGKVNAYRLTQGGWELLSQVHQIAPRELYDHYMDAGRAKRGSLPYKASKPRAAKPASEEDMRFNKCETCRGPIQSRRDDALVCWGCEERRQRILRGMDHVPRTAQYLAKLKPLAARKEQARVQAVIAEHRSRMRGNQSEDQFSNLRVAIPNDKQARLPSDRKPMFNISLDVQIEDMRRRMENIERKLDRLLQETFDQPLPAARRNGRDPKKAVLAALAEALDKL